jgi:hypothetical protein
MAAGLHGSARTTPRVRAELQRAQEATRGLAARYGLNPKTVAKWRRRTTVTDAPMGPARPRSTVLSEVEEAIVVEFRRRTLLPLDDVLGCLRESIPKLTRSALHRCLVRHGISRLPRGEEKTSKRRRFAETTIGYVHVDVRELRLAEGKLFLFLAIDRVSKFAHVAFLDANTKRNGAAFLREVVEAFPYRIHTVLADDGMAFAELPKNRGRHPEIEAIFGGHVFGRVCREHGIGHRLTRPYHPWTTDEVEQPLSDALVLSSVRPRATARRRAGREVRARSRSLKVAPLLRRLWAPSALVGSSPRFGGDKPSRPARPGASPPAVSG